MLGGNAPIIQCLESKPGRYVGTQSSGTFQNLGFLYPFPDYPQLNPKQTKGALPDQVRIPGKNTEYWQPQFTLGNILEWSQSDAYFNYCSMSQGIYLLSIP